MSKYMLLGESITSSHCAEALPHLPCYMLLAISRAKLDERHVLLHSPIFTDVLRMSRTESTLEQTKSPLGVPTINVTGSCYGR